MTQQTDKFPTRPVRNITEESQKVAEMRGICGQGNLLQGPLFFAVAAVLSMCQYMCTVFGED